MLISESSLSYIMVGTLLDCAVRNEGVLAFAEVEDLLQICKTITNEYKKTRFSFQEDKIVHKISVVDGMDNCYRRFSSGRLEVLDPMEFLRCEHLLSCF